MLCRHNYVDMWMGLRMRWEGVVGYVDGLVYVYEVATLMTLRVW